MSDSVANELFQKLKDVRLGGATCLYTMDMCQEMAPKVQRIRELKKEKEAIILAHSYVSPEILCSVADFVGDSFELSLLAQETKAETIIFSAVRFMAETAKILNPTKCVISPSNNDGCSLADSINADDVRQLRERFQDFTFVCYINTLAEVKALCDVCVTSSNAYQIIRDLPNKNVYFLPDKLMAKNIINQFKEDNIQKNIQYWNGTCYVHEEYDKDLVTYIRSLYDDVKVLSHPECSEDVIEESDYVGSTSQMKAYVEKSNSDYFFMLTECGLTSRIQLENPKKRFVGTCTMCKYMKSNQLDLILQSLERPSDNWVIVLDEAVMKKAKKCIDRMFEFSSKSKERGESSLIDDKG